MRGAAILGVHTARAGPAGQSRAAVRRGASAVRRESADSVRLRPYDGLTASIMNERPRHACTPASRAVQLFWGVGLMALGAALILKNLGFWDFHWREMGRL